MRETSLDKSLANVTLRELVETFREVIREEREYYIDDEGYLVFSSERAYADYLARHKGKLPSEVQAYFFDEHGLKVVYSDYEPTPEKARELAETRQRIAEGRARLYGLDEVSRALSGRSQARKEVTLMTVQTWRLEQLLKIRRYQPEVVDQAVEEMLERRADLRWAVVVGAYLDGEINLSKAAELLEMHRLELQERFIAQSIPLRIGPDTVEEAKAELAAIEAWNAAAEQAGQP